MTEMNLSTNQKQTHRQGEEAYGCQMAAGWGGMEWDVGANGYKLSYLDGINGGSAPEETARRAGRSDTPRGAAPASGPRTRSGVSPAGEILRRERERAEETGRGSCCDGGNREQRARGRGQAVRVNTSRGDIRETLVGVFLRLAFTVLWGDSSPAS